MTVRTREEPAWVSTLTRREVDVLRDAAQGQPIDTVAHRLGVGRETVRSHLRSIYAKLCVHDRSAMVAEAWRAGFVRDLRPNYNDGCPEPRHWECKAPSESCSEEIHAHHHGWGCGYVPEPVQLHTVSPSGWDHTVPDGWPWHDAEGDPVTWQANVYHLSDGTWTSELIHPNGEVREFDEATADDPRPLLIHCVDSLHTIAVQFHASRST